MAKATGTNTNTHPAPKQPDSPQARLEYVYRRRTQASLLTASVFLANTATNS